MKGERSVIKNGAGEAERKQVERQKAEIRQGNAENRTGKGWNQKEKKGSKKDGWSFRENQKCYKISRAWEQEEKKIHLQPQALNTKQKPLLLEGKSPCYVNRLFQVAGDQI